MGPLGHSALQMERVSRRSRTQFAAEERSKPKRPNARERILQHLRDVWPAGQARETIAGALSMKVNTVNARVNELLDVGGKRFRKPIPPPLYEEGAVAGCALVFAYHKHPLTAEEASQCPELPSSAPQG